MLSSRTPSEKKNSEKHFHLTGFDRNFNILLKMKVIYLYYLPTYLPAYLYVCVYAFACICIYIYIYIYVYIYMCVYHLATKGVSLGSSSILPENPGKKACCRGLRDRWFSEPQARKLWKSTSGHCTENSVCTIQYSLAWFSATLINPSSRLPSNLKPEP